MKLSDAVAAEGYRLVIDPQPWTRPDVLGAPHEPELWPHCVLLCAGNVLAATGDGWDWAYSAAHEIAEARCGHTHSAEMWAEQAGILGRWIATLGAAPQNAQDGSAAPGPPGTVPDGRERHTGANPATLGSCA